MSKWFNITIVVLIVLWLSLLSLSQLRLTYAMHKYNVIIMQHESDLARIKMLMRPPVIQAKPTPQVAPSAPPLPRHRRSLLQAHQSPGRLAYSLRLYPRAGESEANKIYGTVVDRQGVST